MDSFFKENNPEIQTKTQQVPSNPVDEEVADLLEEATSSLDGKPHLSSLVSAILRKMDNNTIWSIISDVNYGIECYDDFDDIIFSFGYDEEEHQHEDLTELELAKAVANFVITNKIDDADILDEKHWIRLYPSKNIEFIGGYENQYLGDTEAPDRIAEVLEDITDMDELQIDPLFSKASPAAQKALLTLLNIDNNQIT